MYVFCLFGPCSITDDPPNPKYFFDNIVFAPFIFIEDPVDVNGQRGFTQDGKMISGSGQVTPTMSGSGLSVLGKSNKVDAYYLISRVCDVILVHLVESSLTAK